MNIGSSSWFGRTVVNLIRRKGGLIQCYGVVEEKSPDFTSLQVGVFVFCLFQRICPLLAMNVAKF